MKFHSRGRAIAAGFSRSNVFKPTIRPLPRALARARARCHTTCHLISAITLLLPIKNRKRHDEKETVDRRMENARNERGEAEWEKERRIGRGRGRDGWFEWGGRDGGGETRRDGEEKTNEREALFRARASIHRGRGPVRRG